MATQIEGLNAQIIFWYDMKKQDYLLSHSEPPYKSKIIFKYNLYITTFTGEYDDFGSEIQYTTDIIPLYLDNHLNIIIPKINTILINNYAAIPTHILDIITPIILITPDDNMAKFIEINDGLECMYQDIFYEHISAEIQSYNIVEKIWYNFMSAGARLWGKPHIHIKNKQYTYEECVHIWCRYYFGNDAPYPESFKSKHTVFTNILKYIQYDKFANITAYCTMNTKCITYSGDSHEDDNDISAEILAALQC